MQTRDYLPGQPDDLQSSSAERRQSTLDALTALSPEMVSSVCSLLRDDPNDNVRRSACIALGRLKVKEALVDITAVATDVKLPMFLRRAAVTSLGQLASEESIPTLVAILGSEESHGMQHDAIEALVNINGLQVAECLFRQIDTKDKSIKSRIINELGKLASELTPDLSSQMLKKLQHLATFDTDAGVRRASLTTLTQLAGSHVPFILERFNAETDDKNRLRCLDLLGEIKNKHAVETLSGIVVRESRSSIRSVAVRRLAAVPGWEEKISAVLKVIEQHNVYRSDIKGDEIIDAITGNENSIRGPISEILIEHSLNASERIVSVIAALLISNAGGSVIEAGTSLNRFANSRNVNESQLENLRVEVGGLSSLEPVLEKIEQSLAEHFHKPISELNRLTTENWVNTVRCVYWGFLARLVMSICTFSVGLGLTVWSVYQFSLDRESATSIWGAGISMTAGVGSMLAIIYTGPLKDIRSSVEDLARANAVFIGFVHTVLQVSHTFSAGYLNGGLSFNDTHRANQLIQETVRSTTEALGQGKTTNLARDEMRNKEAEEPGNPGNNGQ